MVGGEDEHSSPPSAGTGGDPSLRLSGFIIIGCDAPPLPEERAGAGGLPGPVLPLEGRERFLSFSGFAFLSARSSVSMVWAG